MFRVGKEVLDLPPETHITYRCELSPRPPVVSRPRRVLRGGVKEGKITATNAMVKVLRLAQITGGWCPTDDGEPYHVDDANRSS